MAGNQSSDAGVLQVQGVGFGAGQLVRVGVDGHYLSQAVADASGSFATSLEFDGAASTVTATDPTCRVTSLLSSGKGHSLKENRPPAPSGPEPEPPIIPRAPAAAAIPYIPLTGLAPQLFLGVAGTLLLTGTALIGLAGRIGRR